MRRLVTMLAVVLLTLASTPPSLAAPPPSTSERERALRQQLDQATAAFVTARDGLEDLETVLQDTERRRDLTGQQAVEARQVLRAQAAAIYRSGGLGWVSGLLDDPDDMVQRLELADRIAAGQQARLADAHGVIASHDAAVRDAQQLRDRQRALVARQQAAVRTLQARFREAQALARKEAAATAAARESSSTQSGTSAGSAPAISGTVACPLAKPYSYTDTWGAARSGGRTHEGTDIMAPYGTTVFAYTSGTISRAGASGGLGGTVIYLQGRDGNEYYYAHLASVSVRAGQRVTVGQQVGRNGATGNAPPDAPHVHFEVHPGGGTPVNPYPYVRRACG